MGAPEYIVEGRRFRVYWHAKAFACIYAEASGFRVPVLEKIDDMTPASVVFTAIPE